MTVILALLLKTYACLMIVGSAVLWCVMTNRHLVVKGSDNTKLWGSIVFILVGLAMAIYFVDGWRP